MGGSGDAVHRDAAIDQPIVAPADNLVVDDGGVVNLRHFAMLHAETAGIAIMEMVEGDEGEPARRQTETETEAD